LPFFSAGGQYDSASRITFHASASSSPWRRAARECVSLKLVNRVARMWCRLKDFRRVATQYDKLARNYLSGVFIAATCTYWLN
jgi:transposase